MLPVVGPLSILGMEGRGGSMLVMDADVGIPGPFAFFRPNDTVERFGNKFLGYRAEALLEVLVRTLLIPFEALLPRDLKNENRFFLPDSTPPDRSDIARSWSSWSRMSHISGPHGMWGKGC
jgi:hypothetical protein